MNRCCFAPSSLDPREPRRLEGLPVVVVGGVGGDVVVGGVDATMRLRVFVSEFFLLRGPSPPSASDRLRCRLIRVPPLDFVGFVFLSFDFDVFLAVLDSSSSSSSSSSFAGASHSSATLPLPVVFKVLPFFRKTPLSSRPKASFSKTPGVKVLDVFCLRVDTGISKSSRRSSSSSSFFSLSLSRKAKAEEEEPKSLEISYMSLRSTFRRKLRKILFKGLEEEEELQIIYDNMTTLKREREREREGNPTRSRTYPGKKMRLLFCSHLRRGGDRARRLTKAPGGRRRSRSRRRRRRRRRNGVGDNNSTLFGGDRNIRRRWRCPETPGNRFGSNLSLTCRLL